MTSDQELGIVFVAGFFPIRSETFIEQAAFALAARGHSVCVTATSGRTGDADPRLWQGPGPKPRVKYVPLDGRIKCGLRTIKMLMRGLIVEPAFVLRIIRELRGMFPDRARILEALYRLLPLAGTKPDVVHIQFANNAVIWKEFFILRCPIVVSCRGSDILIHPRVDKVLEAGLPAVFERAVLVHGVSQNVLDRATDYGLDRSKAVVIRPSVPLDRFRPTAIRPATDEQPARIATIGRIHWAKGYEYALRAVQLLIRRGHSIRYTIVGGGVDESRAAVLLARHELDLDSVVDVTGPLEREKVSEILAASDIYLSASLSEGLSSAALEAMGTGLPIVCTDVGGMSEAVRDGVDGFLVPARDPESTADALAKLIGDSELARSMGESARRRIEESFSLETEIEAFEGLYRRAISMSAGLGK